MVDKKRKKNERSYTMLYNSKTALHNSIFLFNREIMRQFSLKSVLSGRVRVERYKKDGTLSGITYSKLSWKFLTLYDVLWYEHIVCILRNVLFSIERGKLMIQLFCSNKWWFPWKQWYGVSCAQWKWILF